VASQTRRQRRAERAAESGTPPRPPQRPTANGDARPPAPPERRRGSFFAESWAELKKVEWPGQSQVIQATVVVLIACVVVGAYLYVNDAVWKPVVQRILGQ
jgi:preprotein translocase subunit SecE